MFITQITSYLNLTDFVNLFNHLLSYRLSDSFLAHVLTLEAGKYNHSILGSNANGFSRMPVCVAFFAKSVLEFGRQRKFELHLQSAGFGNVSFRDGHVFGVVGFDEQCLNCF